MMQATQDRGTGEPGPCCAQTHGNLIEKEHGDRAAAPHWQTKRMLLHPLTTPPNSPGSLWLNKQARESFFALEAGQGQLMGFLYRG